MVSEMFCLYIISKTKKKKNFILYTLLSVMKIVTFVLLTQRKNPLRSQTNLYDEHFIIYMYF